MEMRGTRWLLLAAILVILSGTGTTYYIQKKLNFASRVAQPASLPPNTSGTAADWEWSRTDNGRLVVKIRAHALHQVQDTGRTELEGLQLFLYQRDGKHYDLVKSPKADFNQTEGKLYSNPEVEITLDVPLEGDPPHQLTSVRTSGITFESKTGKASTDRPASFTFASGKGTCTGATYDPTTHELHLLNNVKLDMHGEDPKSQVMHVETSELTYKEGGSEIWLTPVSKMVRSETTIDAGPAVIALKDRIIDHIDAQKANGVDNYPKRKLNYTADFLHVAYDGAGKIQKITGAGNAKLVNSAEASNTTMTADTVDLDFVIDENGDSILTHTTGNGNAVIESKPVPDPSNKTKPAETRLLKSAYIDLFMRDGGKEIERVQTQAPGALEFLPNLPEQHRRIMTGDRMTIVYGAKNTIQSFVSNNVTTDTFPNDPEKARALKAKKQPENSKTASVNMTAEFDEKGQMKTMRQWDNFTYREGDRQARAAMATLENDKNVMDLMRSARVWDASGSTDADHIAIDQKTGDYKADGHVSTSRLPDKEDDKKPGQSSGLLAGDQPVQAMAARMTSANKNALIHYEGNAVLWQGTDRIQADIIDIDRAKHTLSGDGKVVTQLIDKQKDEDPAKKGGAAPFTVVKSPKLIYTDTDRLAHYSGGATMNRPGLNVKGDEIRSYLKEQKKEDKSKPKDPDDNGSRLEKAFADGNVEIVDTSAARKRTGTGIHAEYYTDESKIILRGDQATLLDSLKGTSRGAELTYWTEDDKLTVVTAPAKEQVKSHLNKKKKK
jgi:lipopolysaccharide export system protein LptA